MTTRIPAHLEVSGLIRAVNAAGGFATVIARGEKDTGSILVICCAPGVPAAAYERMPQPDGRRQWVRGRHQIPENEPEFRDYLTRRQAQDPDLWIVELDVPQAERFIEISGTSD